MVSIGSLEIPLGLLGFWYALPRGSSVFRTNKLAVKAAGSNPRFAEASGITPDNARVVGVIISTVLGAVGIVVYAQSYGHPAIWPH